jgi:hypothetical protein
MKYVVLLFLFIGSCKINHLPKERYSQFNLDVNYEFQENTLTLSLGNPLYCPLRIWVKSDDSKLKSQFENINPIVLPPLTDTLYVLSIPETEVRELGFAARLGDTSIEAEISKVELPFPRNQSYPLIQGPDSEPTHNTDGARFALDFGLSIGDTVCASTDGYVVGVIEDYRLGGTGNEWKDYGNFITIYDPESGVFTQYVHLDYKGSFVNVGDNVASGQEIGISGMTGQTNIEHLHFNCLKASDTENGLISIPLDSIGPYQISELKRNQWVTNRN